MGSKKPIKNVIKAARSSLKSYLCYVLDPSPAFPPRGGRKRRVLPCHSSLYTAHPITVHSLATQTLTGLCTCPAHVQPSSCPFICAPHGTLASPLPRRGHTQPLPHTLHTFTHQPPPPTSHEEGVTNYCSRSKGSLP